ncbi:hypothetical protein SCHPADRAFT_943497 [Schizopora paradoxa]|uniref:F-box domain-containing protein n=1 Tax=Schizopora paradoxa TaxID=27342 RepID=A0A0H2RJK9_9AGAM|nr:hypothetical protein SCHPADRAFT_943497 [Schizopora paradoxa]
MAFRRILPLPHYKRKSRPFSSEETKAPEKTRLQDDASKLQATNEINSVVASYLQGEDGLQLPEELQKEQDILNTVTYGTLLEKGIDRNPNGGSNLVSQARRHLSRLELLDGLLTETSSKLKERVKSARQLVDRVVSVCGIASVPPDILVMIFSLAINTSSQEIPRSLHSVRLSHVCRHFRNIITTTPLFWTKISATPHAPEMDLVEASLQRSGESPLDVHINVYIFAIRVGTHLAPPELQQIYPNGVIPEFVEGIYYDRSLSLLLLHTHRWRNLHLNIVPADGETATSRGFQHIQNPDFPTLESITVYRERPFFKHQGRFPIEKEHSREMGFASYWITPMLRTLDLRDCLPCSLPETSLAVITDFKINLSAFENVAPLFSSLLKLEQVQKVCIDVSRLGTSTSQWETQVLGLQEVVLGSARTVILQFDEESGGIQCLKAIFSRLSFPGAMSLKLEATRSNGDPKGAFLHHFLPMIPDKFPNVRNYDIVVTESSRVRSRFTKSPRPTTLPLHFPSDLENFSFTCNSPLWFSTEEARKTKPILPRLRMLTLGVHSLPHYNIRSVFDWVRWIVGQLEFQMHCGSESTFEKLVLLRYDYDRGYKLQKIVPRADIDAWCESRVIFPETCSEEEKSENEKSSSSD